MPTQNDLTISRQDFAYITVWHLDLVQEEDWTANLSNYADRAEVIFPDAFNAALRHGILSPIDGKLLPNEPMTHTYALSQLYKHIDKFRVKKPVLNIAINQAYDIIEDDIKKLDCKRGQVYYNVKYKFASGSFLEMDIALPDSSEGSVPCVMYMYGGSWLAGCKDEMVRDSYLAQALLKKGIAVAAINYRLSSEDVRFPMHIEDAVDAAKFLMKHADTFGIDKSRFGVAGKSAGAYLAYMVAYANEIFAGSEYYRDIPLSCKFAVSKCGPTDFDRTKGYDYTQAAEFILSTYLGSVAYFDNKTLAAASPINYIADSSVCKRALLIHGELDDMVSHKQAVHMLQNLQSHNIAAELVTVANGNHNFDSANGEPASPTQEQIDDKIVEFIAAP